MHDARERNRWFCELVMEVAGDRLVTNAEQQLAPALGGAMTLIRQKRVLVIEHEGRSVAVIAGRSAMAVGKPVIRGNFLTLQAGTGTDWQRR